MTARRETYVTGACAVCFDDPRFSETGHDDHCEEPIPPGMTVTVSRITGDVSAVCGVCGWRSFYWDCGHDLQHDCAAVSVR